MQTNPADDSIRIDPLDQLVDILRFLTFQALRDLEPDFTEKLDEVFDGDCNGVQSTVWEYLLVPDLIGGATSHGQAMALVLSGYRALRQFSDENACKIGKIYDAVLMMKTAFSATRALDT